MMRLFSPRPGHNVPEQNHPLPAVRLGRVNGNPAGFHGYDPILALPVRGPDGTDQREPALNVFERHERSPFRAAVTLGFTVAGRQAHLPDRDTNTRQRRVGYTKQTTWP